MLVYSNARPAARVMSRLAWYSRYLGHMRALPL
jgi:hypothetical protein